MIAFESLMHWLGAEAAACVAAVGIAFVGAWLIGYPVRRLAFRIGAVDLPGGRRVHRRPTARLGGVAVALGVVLGVATLVAFGSIPALPALPIVALAGFVCLLGAIDDVRSLSPAAKVVGLAAAGLALAAFGVRIELIDVPGVGRFELGALAIPATVIWVVACANALNLIDGVDGAGSGVATIAAGVLAAIAFATGDLAMAIVLGATAGGAAGFLLHNRQPARMFLGDSGSLMLGFLLAAASAAGCTKRAAAVTLVAALAALAVPFLDSVQSFVRRFVRAFRERGPRRLRRALRATTVADRAHIHHRLLTHGLSHRQVARVLCAVTLLTGTTALLVVASDTASRLGLIGGLAAGSFALYRLASMRDALAEPVVVLPVVATTLHPVPPKPRGAPEPTVEIPLPVGGAAGVPRETFRESPQAPVPTRR